MSPWIKKLLAPGAVGVAIGGVATFFGTEAVNYYYYERGEAAGQIKEARAVIDPFLHPLPKTVLESEERITGLRGKRLLFQSDGARTMFALAIGHLDEYQEKLRTKERAEAEHSRRQKIVLAAKKNSTKAKRARQAADEQAKKVAAATAAATAISKTISKFTKLPFGFRTRK